MVNQNVQSKLLALHNKRKAKGATILEIIIFMGIAAFILVMVMQGGTQATDNQKVNAEVQNLNVLTTSIRQMFSSQSTYTGLSNGVLLRSSNFPEQMRVDDTNMTDIASGWSSTGVNIIAKSLASGENGFEIKYNNIPSEACVDILDRTYRHFDEVEANGTDVKTGIAAIRTSCVDGTNELFFRTR